MMFLWYFGKCYGISEMMLWECYGILKEFPLDSYVISMVFLWCFLWDFCGRQLWPMGVP